MTSRRSRFATRDQTMMLAIIATTPIQPYDEIAVIRVNGCAPSPRPSPPNGRGRRVVIGEAGIIAAKRIQFSVRTNHVRAAAVDAVLVPRQRVHEWLNEKPERMRFIQLKSFQQFSERLRFAAAPLQVLQVITHFITQERLHLGEIHKITYRSD